MTKLVLPPLRRTAADAERYARVVHAGQVDKAERDARHRRLAAECDRLRHELKIGVRYPPVKWP